MNFTMFQFQGLMAVIFGLTCLLMCYHVGKLEERIARLEAKEKEKDSVRVYKRIIEWVKV